MRRRSLPVLLLILALVAWLGVEGAAQSPKGTKWALLVGVDRYESPDISELRFSVQDVKAVSGALVRNAGFPAAQVFTLTSDQAGPDRPTRVNVLKRLNVLAARMQPEDTLLFYFSGHGFQRDNGGHFLGTIDADLDALEGSALPLELLRQQMRKIAARQVVFILDACRNDPEKGKGNGDNLLTGALARDLATVAKAGAGGQAAAAVLFACSEGEKAYEWPEKQLGVFTYFLLEGIRGKATDGKGRLTVQGLAEHVQNGVRSWSDEHLAARNRRQTPDLLSQGAATLVLAQLSAPAAAQPSVAGPGAPPGFTALFNGRDLSGWEKSGSGQWSVEGGAIVCGSGNPAATLHLSRQYEDFELRFEYRLSALSDSGIGFRYRPGSVPEFTGFQWSLLDTALRPDYAMTQPTFVHGALTGVVAPQSAVRDRLGEWNRGVIRCQGPRIVVEVNGSVVVDINTDDFNTTGKTPGPVPIAQRPRRGTIGLQSNIGRAEFREIYIREL